MVWALAWLYWAGTNQNKPKMEGVEGLWFVSCISPVPHDEIGADEASRVSDEEGLHKLTN